MKQRFLPNAGYGLIRPEHRDNFLNIFDTFTNELLTSFPQFCPVQTDLGYPKVNIYTKKQQLGGNGKEYLYVDIFAPYISQHDIEVEALDSENGLNISVRNHQDKEVDEHSFFVRQIPRSSWKQKYIFDAEFDVKDAKADLKDGILKISIPRRTEPKNTNSNTRRIKIG